MSPPASLAQFLKDPSVANLEVVFTDFKNDGKAIVEALYSVVCKNSVASGVLLHFTELLTQEGRFLEAAHFLNLLQAALPTNAFVCRLAAAIAVGKGDFQMARDAHTRAEKLGAPDEVLMVTGTLMSLLGGHRDAARQYATSMLARIKDDELCFDVAIEAALRTADSNLLLKSVLRMRKEPRLGQQQRMQAQALLRDRLMDILRSKK